MDATQRGNYESGADYVLEYGELRFTFNERDFTERVEQAAMKLGFVSGRLEGAEREDLVNLAVNGEVTEPASALGEHINARWGELAGSSERSLVHWLRRLVFRAAWLDQRDYAMFELAPGEAFGVDIAHLFDLECGLEGHRITRSATDDIQMLGGGNAPGQRSHLINASVSQESLDFVGGAFEQRLALRQSTLRGIRGH